VFVLVVSVVLVGVLGLLNLLLMTAVIRRLRTHTTQLAVLTRGNPDLELLQPGTRLPAFTAPVARPEVIAFLSTSCDLCLIQAPELARYLREHGVARDTALVVIAGDGPAGQELTDRLDAVATVVREPADGPVTSAFGVRLFPTFYAVGDGRVRSGAISVDQLPVPAAV